MNDQERGEQPGHSGGLPDPNWVARCIHYFKRRLQERRTEKAHESAIDRATRGTKWATWFIAIATIVAAGAAISQYITFGKQLGVMQSQLDEMRIAAAIARTQLLPKLKFELKVAPSDSGWHFTPSWTNTGQTDAIEFRGWDAGHLFTPQAMKEFDIHKYEMDRRDMVSTILPVGESIYQNSLAISQNQAQEALNGTIIIMVLGHVEWRDVFPSSIVHYRYWCLRLAPTRSPAGIAFSMPEAYGTCNENSQ